MKRITVTDMTLAKGAKSLSFKEKIEIARHLDRLNVDVIDMPEIENVATDSLLIRTASAFIKNSTVSVSTGMTVEQVATAAAAVSSASIGCASVPQNAFTSTTGGISATSQSTMWIAWFMSAPPSLFQVPRHAALP